LRSAKSEVAGDEPPLRLERELARLARLIDREAAARQARLWRIVARFAEDRAEQAAG
jgi:hypothetical protein